MPDNYDDLLKQVDSALGRKTAPAAPKPQSNKLDDLIDSYSSTNGIDPAFTRAVIGQESGGNPNAKSWAGYRGVMQVGDGLVKKYAGQNADASNPADSINAGTQHLAYLDKKYHGDKKRVLAAYNAGEGNADHSDWYDKSRFWSNDPNVQKGLKPRGDSDKTNTRNYIDKIYGNYEKLRGQTTPAPEADYSDLLNQVDSVLKPAPENDYSDLLGQVDQTLANHSATLPQTQIQPEIPNPIVPANQPINNQMATQLAALQTPAPPIEQPPIETLGENPALQFPEPTANVNAADPTTVADLQPTAAEVPHLDSNYQEYLKIKNESDSPANQVEYAHLIKGTLAQANAQNRKDQPTIPLQSRPVGQTTQATTQAATQAAPPLTQNPLDGVTELPNESNKSAVVNSGETLLDSQAQVVGVDLRRVPKNQDANEYAFRAAYTAAAPKFGLSRDDIERGVKTALGGATVDYNQYRDSDGGRVTLTLRDINRAKGLGDDQIDESVRKFSGEQQTDAQIKQNTQPTKPSSFVPTGTGETSNDDLLKQAKDNVNHSPIDIAINSVSGKDNDTLVNEEYERLKKLQLTDDEKARPAAIADWLKNTPLTGALGEALGIGKLGSTATGGGIGAIGGIANAVGGYLRYDPLSKLSDFINAKAGIKVNSSQAYQALNKFGQQTQIIRAETKKDTGLTGEVGDFIGATAVDVPKFIAVTALTGGSGVVIFGADSFLQSAGRGDTFGQSVAEGGKGALTGAILHGGNVAGQATESAFYQALAREGQTSGSKALIAKIAGRAVSVGSVGSTMGAATLAEGGTPEEALKAFGFGVIQDLATNFGSHRSVEELAGHAFRIYRGEDFTDLAIVKGENGALDVKDVTGEIPDEAITAKIIGNPDGFTRNAKGYLKRTADLNKLFELGYTPKEIDAIKPNDVDVIVKRSISPEDFAQIRGDVPIEAKADTNVTPKENNNADQKADRSADSQIVPNVAGESEISAVRRKAEVDNQQNANAGSSGEFQQPAELPKTAEVTPAQPETAKLSEQNIDSAPKETPSVVEPPKARKVLDEKAHLDFFGKPKGEVVNADQSLRMIAGENSRVTEKEVETKKGKIDLTITHDNANLDTGLGKLRIEARNKDGEYLGGVSFDTDPKGKTATASTVHINDAFRRQGIATAMYDAAESEGFKLTPTTGNGLKPDGRKLWQYRNNRRLIAEGRDPNKVGAFDADKAAQTQRYSDLRNDGYTHAEATALMEQPLRKTAEERAQQKTVRDTADKSSLLPDVKIERDGNALNLNPQAAEITRFVESQMSGQELAKLSDIDGLTLDARKQGKNEVADFADHLETLANSVEANGGDRTTLDAYRDHVLEAAKDNGIVTLHTDESTLEHERTHEATYLGSRNEQNLTKRHSEMFGDISNTVAEHPHFTTFKTALETRENRGLSTEHAALEALAYLPRDYADFGLTREQARDTLATVLTEYQNANPDGLKAFTPGKTGELYKIIQDIENEKTNQTAKTDNINTVNSGGTELGRARADESKTAAAESRQDNETGNGGGQIESEAGRLPGQDGVKKTGTIKQSKTPETLKAAEIPVESRDYQSVTNADQQKFADKQLDKGIDKATEWLDNAFDDEAAHSGATTVVAINLMKEATKRGDVAELNRIADRLVPSLTEHAQAIQAVSVLGVSNPASAGAYAAKIKKQFLGKDLTAKELADAQQVSTDAHETAAAAGVGEAFHERTKEQLKQARVDRDAFEKALDIAAGRNSKLEIKLDDAARTIRNLKAQVKRFVDNKVSKPRTATTQSKLLAELKTKEPDLLERIKKQFGDMSLRMTGKARNPQIDTPEFKKFFEGSKVVDENGEPLVVYHGTRGDWDAFNTNNIGENTQNDGFYGAGISLTDSPNIAAMYADGENANTRKFFVDIKRPLELSFADEQTSVERVISLDGWNNKERQDISNSEGFQFGDQGNGISGRKFTEILKRNNYDGVFVRGGDGKSFEEITAFEPNQIKSAIGNTGEFSKNNDSILRKTADTDLADLTDWSTIHLLENLPKGESLGEFKNALDQLTGGKLSTDQIDEIHAAAVDNLRTARPLTDEQKALNANRNEHYAAADKFANRDAAEQKRLYEEAAKALRGAERDAASEARKKVRADLSEQRKGAKVVAGYEKETAVKTKDIFDQFDDAALKLTAGVLERGAKQKFSDASIYFTLARLTLPPDAAQAKFSREYPAFTKPELRAAILESSKLLDSVKADLLKAKLAADKTYDGTAADLDRIAEAQKINNRDKMAAQRKATNFYDSLVKSKAEVARETGLSFRKANMLTAVKRFLNDVSSNAVMSGGEEVARIPASVADIMASAATGERSLQGASIRAVGNSLKNLVISDNVLKDLNRETGIKAAYNIMKYGADEGELAKLQIHSESHSGDKFGTGGKVIDAYINTVFRSLSAGDALFKTIAFRRSLEEIAKVQAINEHRADKSININERRLEILAHPSEVAQLEAEHYAEELTFQNSNKISDKFAQIKNAHGAVKTAIDVLVPFDRTPTNIVLRVLDYSPYGFARAAKALYDRNNPSVAKTNEFNQKYRNAVAADTKTAYNAEYNKGVATAAQTDAFNKLAPAEQRAVISDNLNKLFKQKQQREFAKMFGRGLTGTTYFSLGLMLASLGLQAGSMSPNPVLGDKKETDEFFDRAGKGIENRSLLIPGIGRFVLPNSPQLMSLTLGATYYEQYKLARKDKDVVGATLDGVSSTVKDLVFEQPLMRTVADLLGSNQNAGQRVGGIASGFIPASAMLKDIGEVGDSKTRRSGASDEAKKQGTLAANLSAAKNSFFGKVPIARNYVADESNFTDPSMRGNVLRRAARFFDITNMRPANNYTVGGESSYAEKVRSGEMTKENAANAIQADRDAGNITQAKRTKQINALKDTDTTAAFKTVTRITPSSIGEIDGILADAPDAEKDNLRGLLDAKISRQKSAKTNDGDKNAAALEEVYAKHFGSRKENQIKNLQKQMGKTTSPSIKAIFQKRIDDLKSKP